MSTKHIARCAAFLAVVAVTANSAAQSEFGTAGRVVIGGERLMGVFVEETTFATSRSDFDGMATLEQTDSATTFSLLGSRLGRNASSPAGGPSLNPRLSVDAFVTDGFSLGGFLTYSSSTGERETASSVSAFGQTQSETTKEDAPTESLLSVGPRLGFGLAVGPTFAIWPRAGITYSLFSIHQEREVGPFGETAESEVSISFLDLSAEFMLAFTPSDSAAILVGPYVDFGLGGSLEVDSTPANPAVDDLEADAKYTSFGLSVALALVL